MTKSYYETDEFGNIYWYKEGTRISHRENGPAIEYTNGSKLWRINGLYHRTDGPAQEYVRGSKQYWLNDIWYPDIQTDEEWIIFQIIN